MWLHGSSLKHCRLHSHRPVWLLPVPFCLELPLQFAHCCCCLALFLLLTLQLLLRRSRFDFSQPHHLRHCTRYLLLVLLLVLVLLVLAGSCSGWSLCCWFLSCWILVSTWWSHTQCQISRAFLDSATLACLASVPKQTRQAAEQGPRACHRQTGWHQWVTTTSWPSSCKMLDNSTA
jgi:hypothetical protein